MGNKKNNSNSTDKPDLRNWTEEYQKKSIKTSLLIILGLVILGFIVSTLTKKYYEPPVIDKSEDPTDPFIKNSSIESEVLDENKIIGDWSYGNWFKGEEFENVQEVYFVYDIFEDKLTNVWTHDGITIGQFLQQEIPEECEYKNIVYISTNGILKFGGNVKGFFEGMSSLTRINGLEMVDFSEISDMTKFFANTGLIELDITKLNANNIVIAKKMFAGCKNLKELNLSSLDLTKLEDASYMFSNCDALTHLNLGQSNTENLLNTSHMFENSGDYFDALIVTGSLNTSNVTDMSYMFHHTKVYNGEFIENLDTSSVKTMKYMLSDLFFIQKINLDQWDVSNVENMDYLFYNNVRLHKINTDGWILKSLKSCEYMFSECTSISSLTLDWYQIPDNIYAYGMFSSLYELVELDICVFDNVAFLNCEKMFYDCESLKTIYSNGFKTRNGKDMFTWLCAITPEEDWGKSYGFECAHSEEGGFFTRKGN